MLSIKSVGTGNVRVQNCQQISANLLDVAAPSTLMLTEHGIQIQTSQTNFIAKADQGAEKSI